MNHKILKNGEKLISEIENKHSGGEKEFPRSFEKAVSNIQKNFSSISEDVHHYSENYVSEVVLAVKLADGFTAVSYEPDSFMRHLNMHNMGTKIVSQEDRKNVEKIQYISVPVSELPKIPDKLTSEKNTSVQAFSKDVRRIDSIDIEGQDRFANLLKNKWEGEKRIELVFHPLVDLTSLKEKIIQKIGRNVRMTCRRVGNKGPFYFNLELTFEDFEKLSLLNPIRAAHSIRLRQFHMTNNDKIFLNGGIANSFDMKTIDDLPKIAIVDGGIEKHSLFDGLIEDKYDNKQLPVSENAKAHGSAVAGAAIFGDLSKFDPDNVALIPKVRVENVHVLSTDNDPDLWDVIDYLEEVVPKMKDIDVINLSMGPDEPISDQFVSRFTASLDDLAYRFNKLFVVASGNDGDLENPLGRIQAPSDAINALSVGAYAYANQNTDERQYSSYSCYGLGRVGAQVKPDVSELGGSDDAPMVLIGDDDYSVSSMIGTSFAAPIVSRKAAQLISSSTDISPLMAKALLIHNAETNTPNIHTGWGMVPENITELYTDNDDEVTILYNTDINPSKCVRLEIPVPINFTTKQYNIRWTIATMSYPDASAADTYSATAITDSFIAKVTDEGKKDYKQSSKPEQILKKEDLKWDTVTKQSILTRGTTLEHPHLIIRSQTRGNQIDIVKYSVVVSIKAIGTEEDIHSAIENEFGVLEPISLVNDNINGVKIDV
ncbi:hypothetical protein CRI85_04160 [Leuconostoc pseudomesenteroides]|uniref:S8 family peptidase n=1 Tax=Leuconostoc pseudomesenteroides TaxID=33968 RepID=UPI001E4D3937|nr:S8 family peptidase [Leuconostoc pseudomesenteroides]MCC8439538.1 hypothetical protein [Leuconostoc pseudomesenteroides]